MSTTEEITEDGLTHGHGLCRLAPTPPATVASGATVEAKPASEPAGEAGGDAGEATGGAESSAALGWQRPIAPAVPLTLAEQAQVAELAELRATVKAVRAHLGGDEDIEAGVLRVLAARDVAEAERDDAREGCRRLNAELEAQARRADGLERIASRQPVAPGPRLLHPQEHPAITAATVAVVGKMCCDADHRAIDGLRDTFAIDDGATPGEVVNVVLASRKADHARIAELRAELADTRRRLTFAECEARDLRAKVGRTLGQRVANFIGKVVG